MNYCDPSGHFPFFLLAALCAVGITALVDYIPDQQFNLHCGWYVGAATGGALIGAGAAALLAGAFGASVGSVVTGAMLTHQMIQAAGFTAGGIMLLDNLQNAVNYQTHVFWSGGTLAQDVGANLAKSVQGITLEMTKLGQYLSKLYVSNRGVWAIASENFANQVKNGSTVFVVLNSAGVDPNSIWMTKEFPILVKKVIDMIFMRV